MGLGIKIKDKGIIEVGSLKEELLQNLDNMGFKYKTMFDKVNSSKNVKETIIIIPELDIEISFENDFVLYIKSKASEHSIIKIEDSAKSDMDKLQSILDATKKYFDVQEININDLNLSNFDIRLIIKDKHYKYRIHLMNTQKGESFIYTIKIV